MLRGTATLVAIDTTRLKLQLWVFVQQFEKFKSISITTKKGENSQKYGFNVYQFTVSQTDIPKALGSLWISLVSVRSKDQVSISGTATDFFHIPRF